MDETEASIFYSSPCTRWGSSQASVFLRSFQRTSIKKKAENRQWMIFWGTGRVVLNEEPYLINGSFLKLKYLKTELRVDNGTYAIVSVTYHSYRIMINLSIICYFELMWHPCERFGGYKTINRTPLRTYLTVFRFLAKCQDSPFT